MPSQGSQNRSSFTHHALAGSAHRSVLDCARSEGIEESALGRLFSLGAIYLNGTRLEQDHETTQGDWIRFHLQPKRYPVDRIEWEKHIILEEKDFILVNKPPGIPVHPTLDNGIENLQIHLGKLLHSPLYVTHRLDVPSQGLVLLAKTKRYQSWFNRRLMKRQVEKRYFALVDHPVAPSIVTHYMKPDRWAPKCLSQVAHPNWLPCQLKILEKTKIEGGYRLSIQLLTGRTHQIRAQMGFLKVPIWGDSLYGSTASFEGGIALQAYGLSFTDSSNHLRTFELPPIQPKPLR